MRKSCMERIFLRFNLLSLTLALEFRINGKATGPCAVNPCVVLGGCISSDFLG